MNRRDFLKGTLYSGLVLGSFGAFTKVSQNKALASGTGDKEAITTVFSTCEMCTCRCAVAVRVKGGRVVKIDGNPNDPAGGGALCARGNSGPALLYDPQRIKMPMIRTGERGDGKYKEVSWEEANQYIADKLKDITQKYGAEAVAFSSRLNPQDWFFRTLAKAMGTPNVFSHEATCPMTRTIALETTFGTSAIAADYGNAKYIISLGRNYFEGIHVAMAKGVLKAINNGAKLVVLDPRFSVTAAKGEWVPIKGGADLAFVMAMANVLISEDLYNRQFIAQYTEGFEQWAEMVKDKTPAWAEQETGIPQARIIEITRQFAAAAPQAIIEFGWHTAWTPNDYQLRRAIMIVNMMVGNWEVPGGYYRKKGAALLEQFPNFVQYAKPLGNIKQPPFAKPGKGRIDRAGVKGTPGQLIPATDGAVGQIPLSILSEKPYPIKGWLVYRFNPVMSLPETERTIEAIKKLDLLVTCDVYMSETAYYSDVILPECTYLERYEPILDLSAGTPKYQLRQPAVPLVYPETKPAWQIFKELGEKLGYGKYFPFRDMEDFLNQQLIPAGLTLGQLREKGVWMPQDMKPFFMRAKNPMAPAPTATPSKKIQIFSPEVEEAVQQGIPVYTHHPQPPEGEFRFVQGKVAVHTNVGTQNVPALNELMPTNTLWINSASAAKLGIHNGDDIIISAGQYEHQGKAKVTEGIRPDTVFVYHGFGRFSPQLQRAFGKGINDNKLIPNIMGEAGNVVTSCTFVKVRKA